MPLNYIAIPNMSNGSSFRYTGVLSSKKTQVALASYNGNNDEYVIIDRNGKSFQLELSNDSYHGSSFRIYDKTKRPISVVHFDDEGKTISVSTLDADDKQIYLSRTRKLDTKA